MTWPKDQAHLAKKRESYWDFRRAQPEIIEPSEGFFMLFENLMLHKETDVQGAKRNSWPNAALTISETFQDALSSSVLRLRIYKKVLT